MGQEHAQGLKRARADLERGTKLQVTGTIERLVEVEVWTTLTLGEPRFQVEGRDARGLERGRTVVLEVLPGPPHAVLVLDGNPTTSGTFFP